MKPSKIDFSIIIPVRIETEYLSETLSKLRQQSYKYFEILVITDKISKTSNPAQKRNLGASMSKGKYLAFLDDDSYPHKDWLKNALSVFSKNPEIAAVCGPCLTPPKDSTFQKASGLVWSSLLGSGGAGSYRNGISSQRYVDDYPSVNLIVSKIVFNKAGGFNTIHWPGEDTLLCLNIVYKLHQKILYHPQVVVYHHRRSVIIPHLQQITRYALHRGNFAKLYPQNSLKVGYLIPSLFTIYLFSLILFHPLYWLFPLFIYVGLLLITFFSFLYKINSLFTSILATITIPITHVYYGILFILGYLTPKLKYSEHKIDIKNKRYLGG